MSRTFEHILDERELLARLHETGEGAPSLVEKCRIALSIRQISEEASSRLDNELISDRDKMRTGLAEAQSTMRKMREIIDRLTVPPWQIGIFWGVIDPCDILDDCSNSADTRVMVCHSGTRMVVNLAEGLDFLDFELGDEVMLNSELTAVLGKSSDNTMCVGETAVFDRYISDGRLVLRCRDEELVMVPAGPLRRTTLQSGDLVRFDRSLCIVHEKVERNPGRRYFLNEVPDARPHQVGGQSRNLNLMLEALKAKLVDPEKARQYDLSGQQTILMIGQPGGGKTLMARIIAAEMNRISGKQCRFAVVKPSEWEDPYVGVTQQNIRNFFQAAVEAAQDGSVILFLDEIECVGRIRGSAVGHHSDKFLGALLAEIDGFKDRKDVAIISATNRKDLVDPALLDRLSDIEIWVNRPDMQGAREIFAIHLAETFPYSPNGQAKHNTRIEIIEHAISRLFSPNSENELSVIRFRDGKIRTVSARELLSGRLIEQICRAARQAAFSRDLRTGESGLRVDDIDQAISDAIRKLSSTLTTQNARAYLSDLPQDMDIVAVEPIARRVTQRHRYLNTR
jgi:proteasome-associated ATPase